MALSTLNERSRWAIDYIIRKEHLSNVKLAEKMGFSPGAINSYRRMHTEPNIEFIKKFCELFDFSLLWFIEGWAWPFKGAWDTHPESKGPNLKSGELHYPDIFDQDINKPMVMLCDESLNISNIDNVLNEAISDAGLVLSAVQKSTLIKAVEGKVESSGAKKGEVRQEYAPIKISEDLALAAKVLESGTSYATALHLNIQSFSRAIDAEDRIGQLEKHFTAQITELKVELKNIKDLREKDRIRKEDRPDKRVEIIKQRVM